MPGIVSNDSCKKLFSMLWMANTAFEMLPYFLEISMYCFTIENNENREKYWNIILEILFTRLVRSKIQGPCFVFHKNQQHDERLCELCS